MARRTQACSKVLDTHREYLPIDPTNDMIRRYRHVLARQAQEPFILQDVINIYSRSSARGRPTKRSRKRRSAHGGVRSQQKKSDGRKTKSREVGLNQPSSFAPTPTDGSTALQQLDCRNSSTLPPFQMLLTVLPANMRSVVAIP